MKKKSGVPYNDWVAIDREEMQRLGANPLIHDWKLRIMWLALARLEPRKHAHFKRGELRTMLCVLVDSTTGLVELPHRTTVTDRVADLVHAGFLRSDSSSECLIVRVATYAKDGKGRNTDCPGDRHRTAVSAA